MDAIFFERQEGQLCAQHCLNNLLQGPIFTAVDLASHAERLDQEERATMAEGGFSSPEFLRFMQQPSNNMDDSGFFSVQVIAKALSVWSLQLESLTSPNMKRALENPTSQQAFICNHDSHWLTVRKLGQQWFNLNSLLKKPELISDTYLSLFLHQLQMEGYSIFVVTGELPTCEADQVLSLIRAEPPPHSLPSTSSSQQRPTDTQHHPHHSASRRGTRDKPTSAQHFFKDTFSSVVRGKEEEESRRREEQELQMALSASLEQSQEQFEIDQQLQFHRMQEESAPAFSGRDKVSGDYVEEEEEEDEVALTAAIYASLEDSHRETDSSVATADTHTRRPGPDQTEGGQGMTQKAGEEEEEDSGEEQQRPSGQKRDAEAMDSAELPVPPTSQEELRKKRLKYLDQKKPLLD